LQQPKLARYLEKDVAPQQQAGADGADGWIEMPEVDAGSSFLSKPIKPIILATGRAVCLFKVGWGGVRRSSASQSAAHGVGSECEVGPGSY